MKFKKGTIVKINQSGLIFYNDSINQGSLFLTEVAKFKKYNVYDNRFAYIDFYDEKGVSIEAKFIEALIDNKHCFKCLVLTNRENSFCAICKKPIKLCCECVSQVNICIDCS